MCTWSHTHTQWDHAFGSSSGNDFNNIFKVKMKIAKSFTTLYYTTRRNIPEDLDLKLHRRENIKYNF